MTFGVQWAALAVLLACALWRLPSMLRGHNRGMFWILACMSLCVALSIPPIYLAVDGVLGERNVANVILRLSLFAVFYLLGSRIAAAYDSPLAARLIKGPVGIAALVLCCLGICLSYLASDVAGSSVGLASLSTHQSSIEVYKWFGLAYVGYISAVVVIPTAKAALSPRPWPDRIAALLMCAGFALAAALVPLNTLELSHGIETIAAFVAILLVAAGLSLLWLSFTLRPRPDASAG